MTATYTHIHTLRRSIVHSEMCFCKVSPFTCCSCSIHVEAVSVLKRFFFHHKILHVKKKIRCNCWAKPWEVPPCLSYFWSSNSCPSNSCISISFGQVALENSCYSQQTGLYVHTWAFSPPKFICFLCYHCLYVCWVCFVCAVRKGILQIHWIFVHRQLSLESTFWHWHKKYSQQK